MNSKKNNRLSGLQAEFFGHIKKQVLRQNSVLEKLKFSVIIPSLNQANYLEQSLLSILNQNYNNIEIIIIDGGSKDQSIEIIKKYEPFIYYWVSEKDKGQSDALNKGFAKATGEIFGWLNSDDLYLEGALERVAIEFSKHPDKKIIFGDWLSIDGKGDIIERNYAFDFKLNHFKYEGFHLNAQSMFWRREVHHRFGEFDIELHNTMDYQMILNFGINEGNSAFHRIPVPLGAFRRYDGQKTGGFNDRVSREHHLMAFRYGYADKYSAFGQLRRLIFRLRRAQWYVRRGGVNLLVKKLRKTYKSFLSN